MRNYEDFSFTEKEGFADRKVVVFEETIKGKEKPFKTRKKRIEQICLG